MRIKAKSSMASAHGSSIGIHRALRAFRRMRTLPAQRTSPATRTGTIRLPAGTVFLSSGSRFCRVRRGNVIGWLCDAWPGQWLRSMPEQLPALPLLSLRTGSFGQVASVGAVRRWRIESIVAVGEQTVTHAFSYGRQWCGCSGYVWCMTFADISVAWPRLSRQHFP